CGTGAQASQISSCSINRPTNEPLITPGPNGRASIALTTPTKKPPPSSAAIRELITSSRKNSSTTATVTYAEFALSKSIGRRKARKLRLPKSLEAKKFGQPTWCCSQLASSALSLPSAKCLASKRKILAAIGKPSKLSMGSLPPMSPAFSPRVTAAADNRLLSGRSTKAVERQERLTSI